MSLVLVPIIAIGVVLFMTKTGFEIGFKNESELQKDMNQRLSEIEEEKE